MNSQAGAVQNMVFQAHYRRTAYPFCLPKMPCCGHQRIFRPPPARDYVGGRQTTACLSNSARPRAALSRTLGKCASDSSQLGSATSVLLKIPSLRALHENMRKLCAHPRTHQTPRAGLCAAFLPPPRSHLLHRTDRSTARAGAARNRSPPKPPTSVGTH